MVFFIQGFAATQQAMAGKWRSMPPRQQRRGVAWATQEELEKKQRLLNMNREHARKYRERVRQRRKVDPAFDAYYKERDNRYHRAQRERQKMQNNDGLLFPW